VASADEIRGTVNILVEAVLERGRLWTVDAKTAFISGHHAPMVILLDES
jgi:hypothetical protein